MLVVGIDKGTSVTKAAVFDESGHQVAAAGRRVLQFHDRPGWHEEDPEDSWRRTADAVRECMAALGPRAAEVVGVGLTGHMGGAWFVDAEGRPVRRSIAWPDTRANDVIQALENGSEHEEYLRITETGALPGMTLPLLTHVARTEPDVVGRTHVVLNAKDFVALRLTGRMVTEPSDLAFVPGDIDTHEISERVLEILGSQAWSGKFAERVPSGTPIGEVTAEAAAATGLPAGTTVIAGLGDAPAAMVGCGQVAPGASLSILGTSWLSANVVRDPHGGLRGIGWMYPMPNGLFAHFVAQQAGASTMDWWLRRLAPEVLDGGDFGALEAEVKGVPEASTRLTFLPYFSAAGTQAPFKAPHLRGTLLGLEDDHGRGDVFRAVYEGLAYAMYDCYSAFAQPAELIRVTGGGAASTIWPGVLSNILGVPVELPATDEGAALGVAILAGVAAGVWPTLEAAEQACVRVAQRIEPDPGLHRAHQEQFARFKAAQRMALDFYDSTRS